MSGSDYGNLGNEMKAMKDGRASLMVETKDNRDRIRAHTERFVAETGKAREKLAAQTRQMLSQARAELKAETHQVLADAGRIIAEANGFLAQTSSDNAKLMGQTHKMLAHAHAETKAQARKVMTQTKAAVAGVKTDTGRVLADTAGVMRRLCTSSRQRAAGWRDILRTVRGNGRGAPSGSVAGAVMERPTRTKPRGKKKASAKNNQM